MISVSALPLLAYKVGPNLFDLSSNLYHVSIRDQMHRAVALAEALVNGNQLRFGHQVLIVGAGVAGVVAGMVLARHGVKVQIIDASKDAPFQLQRGVKSRYIGPYMYEWPLSVYDSQQMPPTASDVLSDWATNTPKTLPFGRDVPAHPDDFVVAWESALEQAIVDSKGLLRIQTGINPVSTNNQVKHWLHAERHNAAKRRPHKSTHTVLVHDGSPWQNSLPPYDPLVPRFVLLAAGMGKEDNAVSDSKGKILLRGSTFWANDNIREPNCKLTVPPRVVVIGGGDGGLQDVLRAATIDDHPLDTWSRLQAADTNNALPKVLAEIQAIEAQHAHNSIWMTPALLRSKELPTLDAAYQKLAKRISADTYIENATLASLRSDVASVHLCIKGDWFTKAYALNRFLVHLLEQCTIRARARIDLKVIRGVTLKSVQGSDSRRTLTLSDGTQLIAEIVLIRFGPARSELPGQWLGLTAKDTVNRQELAAVPLPLYLPPSR